MSKSGHNSRAPAAGIKKRRSTRSVRPMYRLLGGLIKANRSVMASWTVLDGLPKEDRLGIEVELIAAYRAVVGKNPRLQFLSLGEEDDLGAP